MIERPAPGAVYGTRPDSLRPPELHERIERERVFHDARFETDDRPQDRFYWVLGDLMDAYRDEVLRRARGSRVLELGSGTATDVDRLAPVVRSFLGIDISPVAVEACRARLPEQPIARPDGSTPDGSATDVRFEVMNAEALGLPERSLDVVFGSGIIHHLDTERAVGEIERVLAPGGTAIFLEPMGVNPLINAYRARTPEARTADEHPLVEHDFGVFRRGFDLDLRMAGLTGLAAIPFEHTRAAPALLRATTAIDRVLGRVPRVRNLAWMTLMVATRR